MKRLICQFLLQSLVFSSFSCFNNLHADGPSSDFAKASPDTSPKASSGKFEEVQVEKRTTSQPINIINLSFSASAAQLDQMLQTLQELKTTQVSTYQTGKEALQNASTSLSDMINKYKYWLPITMATCIYCSLFYQIAHAHRLLSSTDAWCNWKSDLTFAKLLSGSQKDLALELVADIQKKYMDPQNPTNFVTPMVNFVNDLNLETQELEKYVKIVNMIKTTKLTSIYPIISNDKLSLAQEKINKLAYIKNIFSEWSVEFKQKQLLSEITQPGLPGNK